VTSTDQRSPKGKAKEILSTVLEPSKHVPPTLDYTQLDGSPRDKDSSESPSPSSGETLIYFEDVDPVALALIEELPEPKRKTKNPREKTRSRWFHRKAQQVTGRECNMVQETNFTEETVAPQRIPEPSLSKIPAYPGASQLPERSRQREQKVLEGTGRSAPMPVHIPRPTRRRETKKAGKLPELREDVQRRKATQTDRAAPPVPPKIATTVEKPTVALGDSQRLKGIRPAGSTAAVPPRSETPSHVRNRHAPLGKPASKQRLSTPFEQPADVLRLNAGQPGNHGPPPVQAHAGSIKPERSKDNVSSTPPASGKNAFEQPTDVLMLNAGHPGHHGPPSIQNSASWSKVLGGKANSISTTRPAMAQHTSHSTPELPMTWKYAVGTPSSFEQALDDVVRKLDEMEPKQSVFEEPKGVEDITSLPRDTYPEQGSLPGHHPNEAQAQVRKMAAEATDVLETVAHDIQAQLHKTPAKSALSPDSKIRRAKAMRRLRKPGDAEQSITSEVAIAQAKVDGQAKKTETKAAHTIAENLTPVAVSAKPETTRQVQQKEKDTKAPSLSVEDRTTDRQDRNIDDRDVLKGLKLAVSAACDENLDFWIREKTGLRLRRFLADLKTFEDLEPEALEKKVEKKCPKTGRDGVDEEEAGLGDDEAELDNQRGRRQRAEKRRIDKDREFARKRKQVIKK
jgi:hypothetical protein